MTNEPITSAVADSKKWAPELKIDFSEENPTLFKARIPREQAPEEFNHFQVFVRGGMHQPVEE